MECALCQHPIYRLCVNERCRYTAQFCDNKICHAYLKHGRCPSVIYQQYNKLENEIQQNQKQFSTRVNMLLTQFVEQINFSRQQKIKRRHHKKLGNIFKKLNRARKARQFHFISGKQVKEAIQQIEHLGEQSASLTFQRNFNQFAQTIESFRTKIIQEKDRYFQKMMDEQQSNQQSSPSVVQFHPFSTNQQTHLNTNQNLIQQQSLQISPLQPKRPRGRPQNIPQQLPQNSLKEFLTLQDKQFIMRTFKKKQIKTISKVYTASAIQNGYSSEKFYQKCGQLENTLVVARYKYKGQKAEQMSYFAGFTPLKWGNQEYKSRSFQSDPSNLSTIWWVSQRMVFPIKQSVQNKAIFIDKSFGLYFGNDLMIKFKKDGTDKNTITIGKYYSKDLPEEDKIKLDNYEQSMKRQGRIVDYQVFQVYFYE